MGIKKEIQNIIVILFVLLFIGCKSSDVYVVKDDVYDVKVLIRGPGTCTHIILLNENGKGRIIRGRTLDSHAKEFRSFYDVEYLSYFEITSKKELSKINTIVNSISSSNIISNDYILDARRKEMFVKGVKKYDLYGWKGEKLIKFLKELSPHLPYNINSFCITSSGITVAQ